MPQVEYTQTWPTQIGVDCSVPGVLQVFDQAEIAWLLAQGCHYQIATQVVPHREHIRITLTIQVTESIRTWLLLKWPESRHQVAVD